ncbi:hypothetical protein [Agarilytica rhodophyticola]|uniref:hypothetical protein n=1 Tax=Agarilytica rhodophyticola TaxID=1737490 RepID=UPI000B344723|nr:hypothetical protein [Agarilytica rhodophyticola]
MKYLLVIFGIFLAGDVFAGCSGLSCTNVTITRLYVTADGDTRISTSGDERGLSCDAGSQGYITISPWVRNYDAIYKLLLSAHTDNRPIWVRMSESGPCKLIYVVSDK